jgi:hypothetical protein
MKSNEFTWGNAIDAWFQYVQNPRKGILMWPKRYVSTPDHPNRRLDRASKRTEVLGRMLQVEDLTTLKNLESGRFNHALETLVPYNLILVRYHVNFKHDRGTIKEGGYIEGQQTLANIIKQLQQLEYVHEETYGHIDAIWEEPSEVDPENILVLVIKFES